MLVYLFYALPLLAVCLYGLSRPGCIWMLDWTLLFAGAVTQVTMVTIMFHDDVIPVDSTKLSFISFKKC